MTTVLVTGGAGFIGCPLVERLLAAGNRVVVVDSLSPRAHAGPGRPRRLPSGAQLVTADLSAPECAGAVLELGSPDVVVHLAAETDTGGSSRHASAHAMANVVGTSRMLDALMAADAVPAHLVLGSSRAVYGEGRWLTGDGTAFYPGWRSHAQLASGRWDPVSPSGGPARPLPSEAATTVPRPVSVYGATKLAQEHICGAWAAATGAKLSILRLQNVYGPGQSLTDTGAGVLTYFARSALAGGAIELYEDGNLLRDFVHVDEAAAALAVAVACPPEGVRIVDVGSGTPTSLGQAARSISALAGAPAPRVSGRFRDGDVRAAWCTVGDTGSQLGYVRSRRLEDGLVELLASVEEGIRCEC